MPLPACEHLRHRSRGEHWERFLCRAHLGPKESFRETKSTSDFRRLHRMKQWPRARALPDEPDPFADLPMRRRVYYRSGDVCRNWAEPGSGLPSARRSEAAEQSRAGARSSIGPMGVASARESSMEKLDQARQARGNQERTGGSSLHKFTQLLVVSG